MAFRTEFTPQAEQDLEDISDYLFATHRDFERSIDEAVDLSVRKIRSIRSDAARLAEVPFQGMLDGQLGDGIRTSRKKTRSSISPSTKKRGPYRSSRSSTVGRITARS